MKIEEQIRNWLTVNNYYLQWRNYVYPNRSNCYACAIIAGLFVWGSTNEGYTYWWEASRRYDNFLSTVCIPRRTLINVQLILNPLSQIISIF